jgi:hypothetical protein
MKTISNYINENSNAGTIATNPSFVQAMVAMIYFTKGDPEKLLTNIMNKDPKGYEAIVNHVVNDFNVAPEGLDDVPGGWKPKQLGQFIREIPEEDIKADSEKTFKA